MKDRTLIIGACSFLGLTGLLFGILSAQTPPKPSNSPARIIPNSVPPLLARPLDQQETLPKLVWDSQNKEAKPEPGQMDVPFAFKVRNPASTPITITSVRTSCGCTVAKLPNTPWTLEPGEEGEMAVNVNVRGKFGKVTKTVTVLTSSGIERLTVSVDIPAGTSAAMDKAMRARNLQMATADRQAVFKNDCAECHAKPTVGKMGHALYDAACGICHEAEHRATMVPDLHNLPHETNADYWRLWITHGKINTLMPAFAKENDGPLNAAQINSLVDFLTGDFKHHKPGLHEDHEENQAALPVQ